MILHFTYPFYVQNLCYFRGMKTQDNNKKDKITQIKEKAQQIIIETIIPPMGFPIPFRYKKNKRK